MLPTHVTLVEVGPRDGLQNEAQPIAAADKVELVRRLQAAGCPRIEVTSFVSPKWVPQLADAAEVLSAVLAAPQRAAGVRYSVLTPNLKGLEAALANPAARPDEVVVFGAASEAFSRRNINCGIDESVERFRPVVAAAHEAGLRVRAAISCALGCPYQGEVTPDEVEHVVRRMKDIGVDHCGIADTIGVGTPRKVQAAMERALKHFPVVEVSGHFHDTYGQALANIHACLQMGIHVFDASVAGLGGCPYARGATGNVATEDVVFMLRGMDIDTGIDLDALVDAGAFVCGVLGRPPASRAGRALLARRGAQVAGATT
ncbi:MAG: hydroxymethylglutaryl-CoA lyase [Pseudomonadota bacterium]